MHDEDVSDFNQSAWQSRLESARTSDDFLSLLNELPSEKPMSDDEALDRFKGESTWGSINGAESMLEWCRFWFMAEWCLPFDQQIRCTSRLMREAGYSLEKELEATPLNKSLRRWHASILEQIG